MLKPYLLYYWDSHRNVSVRHEQGAAYIEELNFHFAGSLKELVATIQKNGGFQFDYGGQAKWLMPHPILSIEEGCSTCD